MPGLYIITGSNGAGKSSIGSTFLPDEIRKNYVPFDGDKLAQIKTREFYLKVRSYKEAGKMANEFVEDTFIELYKKALSDKDHFVYEGHFSEDSSWDVITVFKNEGYSIHMFFLGLNDTGLSEFRVATRAKEGGHNVPPFEIEKNFYGNLIQLNKRYAILDELMIIDTSKPVSLFLGQYINGVLQLTEEPVFKRDWMIQYLPALCQ